MVSIAEVIRKYKISACRKLGQNFLINDSICSRIAALADITPDDKLLEVGPGLGSLTRFLLKYPFHSLTLVEKDQRFLNILLEEYPELQNKINIRLLYQDALKFQISGVNKIVSNLPYNIGTELLISWLEQENLPNKMVLMLQKEVVMRITAKEGTKDYGRLSIITQSLYNCKKEFDISPACFTPAPAVTSSVISLVKKENVNIDIGKLSSITRCLFSNRRKILKSSLASLNIKRPMFEQKRAEELSVKDYLSLL